MSPDPVRAAQPLRLLFELSREDNPRLFDDLVRFNKGTKRVNRLRFLAHEGLRAEQGERTAAVRPTVETAAPTRIDPAVARQTNHAFAAPASADED